MSERRRTPKDIPAEMTRAVPVEMLGDPDFLNILKEQARKSAPDSGTEAESESVRTDEEATSEKPAPPPTTTTKEKRASRRRQEQLTKAATNPARIMDPHDRELIPQIERRVADRRERKERASQIYRREIEGVGGTGSTAAAATKNIIFGVELPEWFGAKMYFAATLAVFILLILLKRNNMARKLGFTYALVAELPFLGGLLSGFSGVPAQQMFNEIRQFEQGVHQVLRPLPEEKVFPGLPPPPPPQPLQPPPPQPGRQPITPDLTSPIPAPSPPPETTTTTPEAGTESKVAETSPPPQEQIPGGSEQPRTPELTPQQRATLEREQQIVMLRDEALAWAEEEREETAATTNGEANENEEDDNENEEEETTKKRKKLDVPTSQIKRGKPVVIKNTLSRSQAQTYTAHQPPPQDKPPAAPKKPESAKSFEESPRILKTSRPDVKAASIDINDIPGVSRGKEAREQQAAVTITADTVIPGVGKQAVNIINMSDEVDA